MEFGAGLGIFEILATVLDCNRVVSRYLKYKIVDLTAEIYRPFDVARILCFL